MARGKKASGKNYTSKGERPNVSKQTRKSVRSSYMADALAVTSNKVKAWKQGKRVLVTVPNPGKDAKREPFIKVEATEVWGDPRAHYRMKDTGITEIQ